VSRLKLNCYTIRGYTSECVSCTPVISYKPDCPAPVCVSRLGEEGTLLFSGVVDVAVKSFFWEVRSVSGSPVVTNGLDIVVGIVRRSVGLVEEPEMPGRVCLLGTVDGVVDEVRFVGVGDVVVVVVITIGIVVMVDVMVVVVVVVVGCRKTENNISVSLQTLFDVKISITFYEFHIILMVHCHK